MRSAAEDPFPVVVMYPDLLGAGLRPGGVADRLLGERRRVIALVNGPDPTLLRPSHRDDVTVVVSPASGLAASLRYGYRRALDLATGEQAVVVRIDESEHPPERVEHLAARALICGSGVSCAN